MSCVAARLGQRGEEQHRERGDLDAARGGRRSAADEHEHVHHEQASSRASARCRPWRSRRTSSSRRGRRPSSAALIGSWPPSVLGLFHSSTPSAMAPSTIRRIVVMQGQLHVDRPAVRRAPALGQREDHREPETAEEDARMRSPTASTGRSRTASRPLDVRDESGVREGGRREVEAFPEGAPGVGCRRASTAG